MQKDKSKKILQWKIIQWKKRSIVMNLTQMERIINMEMMIGLLSWRSLLIRPESMNWKCIIS